MNRKVIGIVGPMASGKSILINRLEELGFVCYSLSDILKEFLVILQIPETREALQDFGDFMRKHRGSGFLAEHVEESILHSLHQRVVIDGIRHVEEIGILQRTLKAKIIGITASLKKRYGLLKSRNRPGDPLSWNEFIHYSKRELVGSKPYEQHVQKCLQLTQNIIENEGNVEEFNRKVDDLIKVILEK